MVKNAFGIYLGNPNVHNLGDMLTIKHLLTSIKTRSRFSATSIDQLPASNMRQKLKDIKARDGKVVVIDPRRTETADIASEHHFIRPATDVLLLLAMLNEIYLQGYAGKARANNNRAAALAPEIERIADFAKDYSAESVAEINGIAASEIKRLVKEFCEAESSVCYGRMGVSVQEFGLLSQYLIMLINIVTGRLDEVGGLMFPNPAV